MKKCETCINLGYKYIADEMVQICTCDDGVCKYREFIERN